MTPEQIISLNEKLKNMCQWCCNTIDELKPNILTLRQYVKQASDMNSLVPLSVSIETLRNVKFK